MKGLNEGQKNRLKGEISETIAVKTFVQAGYAISEPRTNIRRYDFIVDIDGELVRCQCKTAREVDPGQYKVELRSKMWGPNTEYSRVYTIEEIDAIIAVLPDERVCLYWYKEPKKELTFRERESLSENFQGSTDTINFVEDYLIST